MAHGGGTMYSGDQSSPDLGENSAETEEREREYWGFITLKQGSTAGHERW